MNAAETVNGFDRLGEAAPVAPLRRTIPFEYAFQFRLRGQPGFVQSSTVTVSVEARSTALSVGCGVVPEVRPLRFGLLPKPIFEAVRPKPPSAALDRLKSFFGGTSAFVKLADTITDLRTKVPSLKLPAITPGILPGVTPMGGGPVPPPPGPGVPPVPLAAAAVTPSPTDLAAEVRQRVHIVAAQSFANTVVAAVAEAQGEELKAGAPLGPRTAAVLRHGIKFNPVFLETILSSITSGEPFDPQLLEETFVTVAAPPERILFKYALLDEGSGREFQSEPILNTAGLGSADGRRPFRYFARPIEFLPRSVIRMQITELSEFPGDLHVALQGYKTLGGQGTPTDVTPRPRLRRRLRRMRR
jgi:hypothetical protein